MAMQARAGRSKPAEKLWFRRKRYGWGWTPSTWEGWLVVLISIIAIFAAAYYIDPDKRPSEFIAALLLICGLLILISYRKGEKPTWSWGG